MNQDKKGRNDATKAEVQRRWKQWLNSAGAPLLSTGLPDEIILDEIHWEDFCTHGRLHMHPSQTGFTVDDISDAHGSQLVAFLEELLTPEEKACSALYRRLRERQTHD